MQNQPGKTVQQSRLGLVENWKQLISPAIFDKPSFFPVSAWTEHIPFAFWLATTLKPAIFTELGTHYGLSYFSFCQAFQKANIKTSCFAVDTWTGDEHAGFYDGNVYDYVQTSNEQYSSFSTLKRMPFNEALPSFADQSIDLLHIDGLHTYEAVKIDFYNWLPKMSAKGVVIFHDTNVHDRNFGVYRLWEELSEQYPNFEFVHGFGLGVLGVGKSVPKKINALFDAARIPSAKRAVQSVYERMGLLCRLEQEHQQLIEKPAQAEMRATAAASDVVPPELELQPSADQVTEVFVAPLEEITMQVYWKPAAGIFTEPDSVSLLAGLTSQMELHTLELNADLSTIQVLRIDPAVHPGVLYLHWITVTNAEGQTLLEWNAIKNMSTFCNLVILKSIFVPEAHLLVSLTSDPMIEINLPPLEVAPGNGHIYVTIAVSKIDDALLKQELSDISATALKS